MRPIVTVKVNMASKPYDSSAATVSLLDTINVIPPATRQKEVITSVGGRDGKYDVGGAIYMTMYVRQRASAKPINMLPHWLWIMVESMEAWWWELIILPRSKMISAGMGFIEKLYWRGCCRKSSWVYEGVTTALLRRLRILVDSMIMPSCGEMSVYMAVSPGLNGTHHTTAKEQH